MAGLSGPSKDIDPYQMLEIESSASADDVKRSYRKLALKHHPDKVRPKDKAVAHSVFQDLAFAYAILSDERRRKRYDTTGNTSESLDIEDDGFSWTDFFRAQWQDVVTEASLNTFKSNYQGSDEERCDVITSYKTTKGDLNKIFNTVMLSNPLDDEGRFRTYINQAIRAGEVDEFLAYTQEPEKRKRARHLRARKEAEEAEEHVKTLRMQGTGNSAKKRSQEQSEAELFSMIQNRSKDRAAHFLDELEAKYAQPKRSVEAQAQNGKKRKVKESLREVSSKNAASGKKRKRASIEANDDE